MRYYFTLLLLLAALLGRAQSTAQPCVFLQVYQPLKTGYALLFTSPATTTANLSQLFAAKFEQLGYTVVTDRQSFRQLAPARYADFIYADVICHLAGGQNGVTLIVRDSIHNVLLQETDARSSYLGAGKAIVQHSRFQLRNRGLMQPPVDEGPLLINFGDFSPHDYAYELYADKPMRRLLDEQGVVLELSIDELGLPSLGRVLSPSLDDAQTALLARVLSQLPRWRPAYADGRRVAVTLELSMGRAARN